MGDDDALVKILSYLNLDYSMAIQSTKMFEKTFSDELKKIENLANTSINNINRAFGNIGKALSESTDAATQTAGQQAEKVSRSLEVHLARIEKQLLNAERIYQRMGVESPGIQPALAEVRGYRDIVVNERMLNEEQQKAITLAGKFAGVQENTARAFEKQIELYSNRNNLEEIGAESAQKDLLAEQRSQERINELWDAEIAKQQQLEAAERKRQEESAWRMKEKENLLEQQRLKEQAEIEMRIDSERSLAAEEARRAEEAAKAALPTMQARAAEVQRKIAAQGLSAEYVNQADQLRRQIESVMKRLQLEGKLTAEEVTQTMELQKQVGLLEAQTKTASADKATIAKAQQGSNYNVIGSQWERRASWFLAGSVFFGLITGAREAVGTMKEVEMGMIEIARITEDASFNFREMREDLMDLGVEYGQTFDNVQDISVKWAQAGYNVADTIKNTEASLLALNTAELNAEQATQGLIAIMSQWQLTSADLVPTIDKINKVADDFAITSTDIVDGLIRTSAAAKNLGMTIEDTISVITVLREASGRTGREVGNAINTILSYLQRTKSIDILEQLGIRVFADEAKTQFRDVMDVFRDIATAWDDPTVSETYKKAFEEAADEAGLMNEELAAAIGLQEEWNDLQKRDVGQGLAGVRRRTYLISLLKRFSRTQEVANSMLDAEGYSMRENLRTMDSLEKKYNSLLASAEKLAVALGEAGLLESLKALTDAGMVAIEAFNSLDETVRSLIINIGLLYGGFKLVKGIVGMLGVGAATGAAAGAAGTAGAAAAGASAFGPLGWGLLAAGAITMTAISSVNKANEKIREQTEVVGSLGKEYFGLKEKIDGMDSTTSAYASAQEKLKDIMQDIANVNPSLLKDYNDMAEITAINEESLRKFIDAYESMKKPMSDVQKGLDSILLSMNSNIESISSESEKLRSLADQYERLEKAAEDEISAREKQDVIRSIEEEIIGIIGERELAEVKASGNIITALDNIIEKRQESVNAERDAAIASIEIQKQQLEAKKVIMQDEIDAIEAEQQGQPPEDETFWQSLWRNVLGSIKNLYPAGKLVDFMIEHGSLTEEEQEKVRKGLGFEEGDFETPLFGGRTSKELSSEKVEKLSELQGVIEQINILDTAIDDLISPSDDTKDKINETAVKALSALDLYRNQLDVQKRINAEIDARIGLSDSTLQLYNRENASIEEQILAFSESIAQVERMKAYQEGIKNEISLTEGLLKSLNAERVRYEDSIDEEDVKEYEKLSSEIDSLTGSLGNLRIKHVQLEQDIKSGISTQQLDRIVRSSNIELLKMQIEYMSRETASVKELNEAENLKILLVAEYEKEQNDLNNIIAEQTLKINEATEAYKNHADQQDKLNAIRADANDIIAESKLRLLEIKSIIEDLNSIGISDMDFRIGITGSNIDLMKSRIDYLTRETAGVYELNAADDLRLNLVKEYQSMIDELNGKIAEQINRQNEATETLANDAEKQGLLNSILLESNEIVTDAKKEIIEYTEAIEALNNENYFLSKAYDDATKSLEHWSKMGVLDTQQQIDEMRRLSEYHDLSTEEQWNVDEKIFNQYKEMLKEQTEAIEDAYNDRIEKIEDAAEKEIEINEDTIRKLRDQKESASRDEDELGFDKTIADLEEDRRYHEVRTGEEHRKAIIEIDEKIAEEKRQWQYKQDQQAIDDQIDTLEDKNREIQNAADDEKKAWEKVYEEMGDDFDTHNIELIALAATYNPAYYDDALEKGKQWVQAFKEGVMGDEGIEGGFGGLMGDLAQMAAADNKLPTAISGEIRAAANNIVWLKGKWTDAYKEGNEQQMNLAEIAARQYYRILEEDKIGRVIADNLHRMNYEQAFDYYENLPKFHSGGKTLSPGMAVVKPGEIFFPEDLSAKIENLISFLGSMPAQNIKPITTDHGEVNNFYGPLFNSEKTVFEDDTDQIGFARELKRAIQAI